MLSRVLCSGQRAEPGPTFVNRISGGQLVINQTIGMRISLLKGSVTGTAVYMETLAPMSNANGLVTMEIGGGTVVAGSFSTIDWNKGPYFALTMKFDYGTPSENYKSTRNITYRAIRSF
jgi:hypothetical protein